MTHAQDFNGSINISYVENDKKSWWIQSNNFGFKFYPFYQQTKLELKKANYEVKLNLFFKFK